jgi:hypothetical protein
LLSIEMIEDVQSFTARRRFIQMTLYHHHCGT